MLPYIWGGIQNTGPNTNDVADWPRSTVAKNGTNYDDFVKLTVSESFKTYIMFRPSGTDIKDVPLKYISWSWSGVATYTNSGWSLENPGQSHSEQTETTEYPVGFHLVTPNYVPDI